MFLILAGLTGSVIAFQKEIDQFLNPGLFKVASGGEILSPSELVLRVERQLGGIQVNSVELPASADDSVRMWVTSAPGRTVNVDQVFVDPASGAILGARLWGAFRLDAAHIMPFIYKLHYTLHLPDRWGRWLLGVVALAWAADCFVGAYLTLPRARPFLAQWRSSWTIKRPAGAFRLNFDLHRAGGLWLWPVLLLLAVTSVALNLDRELFRPVLMALLPTSAQITDRNVPHVQGAENLGWDAASAVGQAEARRRNWQPRPRGLYLDEARGHYGVQFDNGGVPHLGLATVYVDAADGAVQGVRDRGAGKPGDVVADLVFPVHSGHIAGLPGRVAIALTGLVVAGLSVTGIVIWWKKRRARASTGRKPRSDNRTPTEFAKKLVPPPSDGAQELTP
jgi:uncharacterized iron-regulated membrane protein